MDFDKYFKLEEKLSLFFKNRSITLLRLSMSFIYIWYGLLKIMGISPVEELVYHATHWIGTHNFVIILGFYEVITGALLSAKKSLRIGLILLFFQFPGTFLPLFLTPTDCFSSIPFGLTLEGQYIFKNLILISAALLLVASLERTSVKK